MSYKVHCNYVLSSGFFLNETTAITKFITKAIIVKPAYTFDSTE